MTNRLWGLFINRVKQHFTAIAIIVLLVAGILPLWSSATSMLSLEGVIYSALFTITDAASTTVDWSGGNVQSITLSIATTTFTFTNPHAGGQYSLIVNQDGTG